MDTEFNLTKVLRDPDFDGENMIYYSLPYLQPYMYIFLSFLKHYFRMVRALLIYRCFHTFDNL